MPPYVCQPDAVKLRPGRMGSPSTRTRRYDNGEKALREMDTEGHQEHGRYRVENAGVQELRTSFSQREGQPDYDRAATSLENFKLC